MRIENIERAIRGAFQDAAEQGLDIKETEDLVLSYIEEEYEFDLNYE